MDAMEVAPLQSGPAQPRRARLAHQRSWPTVAPKHLNSAARLAWADIVASQPGVLEADESVIERAAILLSCFRSFKVKESTEVSMDSLLRRPGLSPVACARLKDTAPVRDRRA